MNAHNVKGIDIVFHYDESTYTFTHDDKYKTFKKIADDNISLLDLLKGIWELKW